MKEIRLTSAYSTTVDDADFDRVTAAGPWGALVIRRKDKSIRTVYAHHKLWIPGKGSKTERLHRFLLAVTDRRIDVDHKDGDGLNNQRHNLRQCSRSQNLWNQRKSTRSLSSRFKGVRLTVDGKWLARLKVNKREIYLGVYHSEIDAAKAYNLAATKHCGEFAYLNQVEPAQSVSQPRKEKSA